MKKIDRFINCYPLSKTLRFELIPQGKTLENMTEKGLIAEDERRAENYVKVKEIIDEYHRVFIERILSDLSLDVTAYANLYSKSMRSDEDENALVALEEEYRKKISNAFLKNEGYKNLSSKKLVNKLLPDFVSDPEQKKILDEFYNFTTYFVGFNKNRENMYTDKPQGTGIAHRCINENLPKYIDNQKVFAQAVQTLSEESVCQLQNDMADICGADIDKVFAIERFDQKLSQTGIDMYNTVIGGYTLDDGTKIKGLNEYINLYNQTVERSARIAKLKPLYKQILSDVDTRSFIPDSFDSDQEVLDSLKCFYEDSDSCGLVSEVLPYLRPLFEELESYDMDKIYITAGIPVTEISNAVFGSWNTIQSAWNMEYDAEKGYKETEKYLEARKKAYKKNNSFSIAELDRLGNAFQDDKKNIAEYLKTRILDQIDGVLGSYEKIKELISSEYKEKKRLAKNQPVVNDIKAALDTVKDLERTLKYLIGSGKESIKDETFYGQFFLLLDRIMMIDRLYDKVRNHMTQKSYSTSKFKLNFQNPQFMGGWDRNKEKDYRATMIRDGGKYYIVVMDKSNSKAMEKLPESEKPDAYEKIDYKLLPDPSKMLPKVFFSKKGLDTFNPSEEVMRVYKSGTFKKGKEFSRPDMNTLIDFYKASIPAYESWSGFDFTFRKAGEYEDIGRFYYDVKQQGYKLSFRRIDRAYIDAMVENGQIYLFQIYNKDFSEYSKGTPNLHTLYFRMLFDERNLSNVVFQMNGGAEMFYRRASITEQEKVVHPANHPVKNKNPENAKKESLFAYDLVKDRRYTVDKFFLHLPITLNFKGDLSSFINEEVRKAIHEADDTYIIGIDRGERNLLYICVINAEGDIVEQYSLNDIVNEYNGIKYKTDYQALLVEKEKARTKDRQDWKTIENIKELKEGYLSQVVSKICELVIRYDAIVCMEDLNTGFKNSRIKVERQVYQKFENMLVSKLRFLASKKKDAETEGGLLNAYQLTNKEDKYKSVQNGFLFYVPAWCTSKIDPTTGFVDLLKCRYESISQAREFINRFDKIYLDSTTGLLAFDLDYDKFKGTGVSYKKKWTLYANGSRIKSFRNPEKNSEWDSQEINLMDEFRKLFRDAGIELTTDDMREQLAEQNEKDFFVHFLGLLKLTLQLRNSIPNKVDVDYLISPVMNAKGEFYDSRNYKGESAVLPADADANGAYNIARKGLWAVNVIKAAPETDLKNVKLYISNKDWLEYAQNV